MHVLDAIEQRRSIKAFDPDHRFTPEELETLLHAGRRAPTAFNIQHPRFVVLQDPELRRHIRELAWGQAQVTDASALFILCADLKAWEKDPARYWRNAPPAVQDTLVGAILGYYQGREMEQRDECMRSCGLAAQNMMLAAQAMGYASCPMDGFDFAKVGEAICLPEDHVISMFVAVGRPLEAPKPRSGPLDESEQVVYDRFPPPASS